MPFLRPLLESVASSLELRSSKTLIGSGASTCDVVIAGENVLELHALLNLTADNTSAKLVPFSTASAGVCYVNDNVVPRDGAVVVHGDRVAFGGTHNAFLFELTPSPPTASESPMKPQRSDATVNSRQRFDSGAGSVNTTSNDVSNSSRAFRKALDVLRGDRKATTPNASVLNGDMDFQASYLSPSSKRRRGSRPLWSNENDDEEVTRSGRDDIPDVVEEDEDEDSEEDELPAMMEKPAAFTSAFQPANVAISIRTESSEQEEQPPQQEAEAEEATRRRRPLDDSLESMPDSEIDRSQRQPDSRRQSVGDLFGADPTRDSLPRAPIAGSNHRGLPHSMGRDNTRTALHQKLIDQTIRRKRQELTSQAFVRWNRGLRIQNQRRRDQDAQIAETNDQLELLLQNAEHDVEAARFGAAQVSGKHASFSYPVRVLTAIAAC
ncbi:hypothetical protein BBJ28_00024801 [Nothophytophthora sp. Chile5]|nr:hypothetical protein BBJ28_00024801 [Nothophytophthora sp. Chile5]